MQFKIDTKPTYFVITPEAGVLDANLAAALSQKCQEMTESGSENFIVNLENCTDADIASEGMVGSLLQLHEFCYDNDQSLVFTQLQDRVMNRLKEKEIDLSINVAPSMQEAVDIISMEILERDLFNEEEP